LSKSSTDIGAGPIDEAQLVRERGLDPAEWYASKIRVREWTQGKTPCRSAQATLTRRIGPALVRDVRASLRALGRVKPLRFAAGGGGLAEIHLNDAHIAAWENGDIKAFSRTLFSTGAELVRRAIEFERNLVERVLLVVNGDWLHADTVRGETTKGTKLEDVAVPYEVMFREALGVLVGLVNWIAPQRPVEVEIVPGNHDFHSLFAVGMTLEEAYRDNRRVTIRGGTVKYRYVRWGTVLLGFAHGDTGKLGALPGLMAGERARDWGETTWREWHTGHRHADAVFERDGCRIRCIPALTKRNEWAKNQGHGETTRGAEAFLWHRERGYVGHLHQRPLLEQEAA
jgi:hypothetical protein